MRRARCCARRAGDRGRARLWSSPTSERLPRPPARDRRLLLLRARRPHRAGRSRAGRSRSGTAPDGCRRLHGGQLRATAGPWSRSWGAAVVTADHRDPGRRWRASRLRGPYLAGATLAFAVGLPALADRFPTAFGGENGLTINPPTPPPSLGVELPARALAGVDRLHRRAGRRVRLLQPRPQRRRSGAARDARRRDRGFSGRAAGRAVAHAGVHAQRGRAGLGGGLLAVVHRDRAPGAFPIQLSLTLLAGVVIGGLGS